MGEFTYLVFMTVASVVATLITVFAAGVVGVLLHSPEGTSHHAEHTPLAVSTAERYAA